MSEQYVLIQIFKDQPYEIVGIYKTKNELENGKKEFIKDLSIQMIKQLDKMKERWPEKTEIINQKQQKLINKTYFNSNNINTFLKVKVIQSQPVFCKMPSFGVHSLLWIADTCTKPTDDVFVNCSYF